MLIQYTPSTNIAHVCYHRDISAMIEDQPMTSLAVLRRRKLLTQRQLAERAQVAPSTIYVLEAGRRTRPRFKVLQKIAGALHVEVEEVDEFRRVIEGTS